MARTSPCTGTPWRYLDLAEPWRAPEASLTADADSCGQAYDAFIGSANPELPHERPLHEVPFAERKRYYSFTVGNVGFFVLDEVSRPVSCPDPIFTTSLRSPLAGLSSEAVS